MISRIFLALVVAGVLAPARASAQSFAADVHLAASRWSEFEGNDLGLGGRLTWRPMPMVGVDADLTWYRSDFPDGIAFTRSRFEGLFGLTAGPRLNRVRPFAKAAAGFLKVGATPGAFACIAIFPPPLNCALAGGDTLPAFEVGGGVELDATTRTFIRADLADRILRYPGPAFDSNFEVRDAGFFGHALRFAIGAGIRF
jgi:hypothetical protein